MTELRAQVIEVEILATGSDVERFTASTYSTQTGACVTFVGAVREHDGDRRVQALEYVAHPTAAKVLRRVALAISEGDSQLSGVRVAHRVGLLQVGECALFAEVCAPHRAEAFLACSRLVDEVKRSLPVWKRQVFADGTEEWVNCP